MYFHYCFMDLIYAVCIGDSEKKGEENSEKKCRKGRKMTFSRKK